VLLFFINLVMTMAAGEKAAADDVPFTETVMAPAHSGWQAKLDALRYWGIASVALCLIVYGPFLWGAMPLHLNILPLRYP